jgi:hypothetical protein
MASSTRLLSRAGLPPSGLANNTKGLQKDHFWSVSSPRGDADLHARDQCGTTPATDWEHPNHH